MAEIYKPIDVKRATPEEIAAGLSLLNKKKEYEHKVKTGEVKKPKTWKELSEAEKEKARAQGRKATARQRLLNIKAVKAGITVSEEEIQAELKGKKQSLQGFTKQILKDLGMSLKGLSERRIKMKDKVVEEEVVWYSDVSKLVETYTRQKGIEGVIDIQRLLLHLLDLIWSNYGKTSTN